MPKYDFTALNDKEFEELVCELLNKEYKLQLQSFKKGKDKGVDLRYSTNGRSNAIVVQAKQYTTTFTALYNNLKKEELNKVRDLKPKTYWVVTSLLLSALEKDKIKDLFTGFMPDANHVISGNDLNRLLTKHKNITKNWLKLWLTNTSMLERVINNALHGRSEFYREKIISRVKLYVKNKSLYDASELLKKNKFLLISGQPGVGKTTLADILTYEFLALKYQLVYIDKDIEEAGDVFETNKDVKQIIYFDDFLGANHLEIMNLKSSESAIVRFIERVQASKNKYMILTTRTTILKDAKENYEKLNRANIDLHKKELKLEDYSIEDKGRILYNHLYNSNIPAEFKIEVFSKRNYWQVIRHKNYIPRLIEFFTNSYNLSGVKAKDYVEFMVQHLTHPHKVWEHSFTKQLRPEDRFLITSLYTFGNYFTYKRGDWDYAIPLSCLQKAFDKRMAYEIKVNGFTRPNDAFNASLKRLLDGYITSEIDLKSKEPKLKFLNPSIADFITYYLEQSNEERWKVISGAVFIEQLAVCVDKLFTYKSLGYDGYLEEANKFLDFFADNKEYYLPTMHLTSYPVMTLENAYNCEIADLLHELRFNEDIDPRIEEVMLPFFSDIDFKNLGSGCFSILTTIIEEVDDEGILFEYISTNWESIITGLWLRAGNDDDFEQMETLFERYDKSLRDFVNVKANKDIVQESLSTYINDKNFSDVSDEEDSLTDEEDLDKLKKKIRDEREELFDRYFISDPGYDEDSLFESVDIKENKAKKRKKDKAPALLTKEPSVAPENDNKKMERMVDDLFSVDPKNPNLFPTKKRVK